MQEAEKEAELAQQWKAEKAEKKKQAKNKNQLNKSQTVPTKPAPRNMPPPQAELRPYARSRPIGQTSKQDTSADQSEMRAPADQPIGGGVSSPAVYVRGQKRKVSKGLACFCYYRVLTRVRTIV